MVAHSSRANFRAFRKGYVRGRLHDSHANNAADPLLRTSRHSVRPQTSPKEALPRTYTRDYVRWLKPHRYAIALLLAIAMAATGLQMLVPLIMRFIIYGVLLSDALDGAPRLMALNLAGAAFLAVVALSALLGLVKDYRQRLINSRLTLRLRRALFHRLLHLPLATLSDMTAGGILSRLTGDIDLTTGLPVPPPPPDRACISARAQLATCPRRSCCDSGPNAG